MWRLLRKTDKRGRTDLDFRMRFRTRKVRRLRRFNIAVSTVMA